MQKKLVLLIDDNDSFLSYMNRLFSRWPEFEVAATASSGVEGLAIQRLLRPDVAIVDLVMPGLNGLQTIAGLRHLRPDMVIIAASVWETAGIEEQALAHGADAFLNKSALSTDLIPLVQREFSVRSK